MAQSETFRFPRSTERGLIEAVFLREQVLNVFDFPRSPERGLIEACGATLEELEACLKTVFKHR